MKRVLVVQTAYLGDVILSQPLWSALKTARPDVELDVLVQPQWAPLLTADPALSQIITFDKRGSERGFSGLWRTARRLADRGYDAAICPHPSFRSAGLLYLARIPQRVGFADSSGRWLFTHRVPRDISRHEVERILSLLTVWNVPPADPHRKPKLWLDPHLEREAERKLRSWGIAPEGKYVCVHPGSVWATKRWLPEGFAGVLSELAEEGYQPVVLGGAADIVEANLVQDRVRELPINLAGRLTLPELALVLARAALLVTNDSGPMHIAGALGTPVAALFGSTTPQLGYAPVGSPSKIIEHPMLCRPCGPHGYRKCPQSHFDCMKLITVEQVLAACRELLQSTIES